MVDKKKFAVVGNTSWGHCFTPVYFDNKAQALKHARECKRDGYWSAYRIFEV